jgi:hypothetical protein
LASAAISGPTKDFNSQAILPQTRLELQQPGLDSDQRFEISVDYIADGVDA